MTNTKISEKAASKELALAVAARDEFEMYGHIGGDPREAGLSELRCLQVDLIRWEVKNFSVQPIWTTTLGVFEELGELLEAIGDAQDEEVIDAVGDFMVYTVNLCTKLRLDFHSVMAHANYRLGELNGMDLLVDLWKNVGLLSHVILKAEQGIRGYDDVEVKRRDACIIISRLVADVTTLAFASDISAEATLFGVAEEVMQRDWVKYPVTGLPPVRVLTKDDHLPGVTITGDATAKITGGASITTKDGVEHTVDSPPPSYDYDNVPCTGRFSADDGLVHYCVDGEEVSEEVFEAKRG